MPVLTFMCLLLPVPGRSHRAFPRFWLWGHKVRMIWTLEADEEKNIEIDDRH